MWTLALCAAMSASAPDTMEALERLAPQARWVREPLAGLDAELVVLPTKLPNRFVVTRGRVAPATLEAVAPLLAPLDAKRAARLVEALETAELVTPDAPVRLRGAGFPVAELKPIPVQGAFLFDRLELRSAQSAPSVVAVRLAVDEQGRVERHEQVLAQLASAGSAGAANEGAVAPTSRRAPIDRSAEIERFIRAARGTSR